MFSLDMATLRKLLWCETKVNKVILGLTFTSVVHRRSPSLEFVNFRVNASIYSSRDVQQFGMVVFVQVRLALKLQ